MDIFEAVQSGNEEEVSRLLDADPTLLEETDELLYRPLLLAAEAGQLGMVKLLVQRDADINASGAWRRTALHCAAQGGHDAIVDVLLSKGARADIKAWKGMTPLMVAASRCRVSVVRMLLQHMGGEGLADGNDDGKTLLHWAAEGGSEELVVFLLGKGAPAISRTLCGETPLILAAYHGHMDVVQLLVQHMGGQGINEREVDGSTALHWATEGGYEKVIRYLLLNGADPTIAEDRWPRRTPQALAWAKGHQESSSMFYVSVHHVVK
jgi:ankyrin